MANENGWGDGSVNNAIGWGQGANNAISWGKSHLDSWSGATDIDGGNAPINTVAPALSGTAQEGQTLTCSTGTWSGSPTYTYQWKRNGNNIGSATNSTYTLVTADVGQSIKCTVTATNGAGSVNADSNTVVPIAAFSFLLDTYSGGAAAYSLRKLRSSYSGNCIRVRRSSDNTEQDFGFLNNVLDTTSLTNFVGANNGFVTTWYDQSGNARNLIQTTAANQPQIVSSGAIINVNSKPSIQLDGTNDFMQVASSTGTFNFLHNGTNSAIFSTVKFGNSSNPNAGYVLLDNGGIATASIGVSLFYDDRAVVPRNNVIANIVSKGVQDVQTSANVSGDNAISPNVQNLVSLLLDGDNATASQRSKIKINAGSDITNNTVTNAPTTSNSTYNMTMGRTDVGGGILYMLGNAQEIIIYASDQSSNQSGINSNINTFYSIY